MQAAPPVVVVRLEEPSPTASPRPSISIAEPGPAAPAPPLPVDSAEQERVSLAEAFAGFNLARVDDLPAPAARGAVDITRIEPAREVPRPPPPPPPPPPPQNPSRQWVQVATGQDIGAFRFDWRRISRAADGLLNSRDAYSAKWGQTNRLVTGPFASAKEAQDFVTSLQEKGVESFRFSSAAGEEVKKLP